MEKIKIQYNPVWQFMPSNIFKALIKRRKHKIVKKFEKDLSSMLCDVKENFNSEIYKLLSININSDMRKKDIASL